MEIKEIFEKLQQYIAAVPDVKPKRISGFAIEDYNDFSVAWLPYQGVHHDKQRKVCVALSPHNVFASKTLYDENLTDNLIIVSPLSKEYATRKVINDIKMPKWYELLKSSGDYETKTFPVDAKSIRADLGMLLAKQAKMSDVKITKNVKANTTILCRFANDDEEEFVLFDYYRLIEFVNAIENLGAEYVYIRCLCPTGNTFSTQIAAYTDKGQYLVMPMPSKYYDGSEYRECVNNGAEYYYLSLDMAKKIVEFKPHVTALGLFNRAFPLASDTTDENERLIPVFPVKSYSNVIEKYVTYGDAATLLSQLLKKATDIKVDYSTDNHYLYNNAENASGILNSIYFSAKDLNAVKVIVRSEGYGYIVNKFDIFRHDTDIAPNGDIEIIDEM